MALLLFALMLPALAAKEKKKSKFLAAYPMIFKFFLFWWCIFVFAVMSVYIIDHVLYRRLGSARVDVSIEHVFRGVAERKEYWAQLVDPRSWSTAHPVLQSADVRMVQCASELAAGSAGEAADGAMAEGESVELSTRLKVVPLGPLEPGLGLILRHKDDSGPRAGNFYCTRKCMQLETPAEGPWRVVMRTVEVGGGYPFLPDTEETEFQMWPAAEDGSIRCSISGFAAVNSRFFRWWTGLTSSSKLGATAMLEAIGAEVEAAKKQD